MLVFASADLMTYVLRLYVNNHTPALTDTAADYTEPAGTWYVPITLVAWGTPFVNPSNQGEIDEVIRTFTVGGTPAAEQVYGYFVTDGGGNLVWSELNPAGPQAMDTAGQTYSVLPIMRQGDLC
jgi:hypothetical protein